MMFGIDFGPCVKNRGQHFLKIVWGYIRVLEGLYDGSRNVHIDSKGEQFRNSVRYAGQES